MGHHLREGPGLCAPGCAPVPAHGGARRAGVCAPVTAAATGTGRSLTVPGWWSLLCREDRALPAAPANGHCCGAVGGTPASSPLEVPTGTEPVPSVASSPSLTCFSAPHPNKLLQPRVRVCTPGSQPRKTGLCLGLTCQGPRVRPSRPPLQAFAQGSPPAFSPELHRNPAGLRASSPALSRPCPADPPPPPLPWLPPQAAQFPTRRMIWVSPDSCCCVTCERTENSKCSLAWEVFGFSRGACPRALPRG